MGKNEMDFTVPDLTFLADSPPPVSGPIVPPVAPLQTSCDYDLTPSSDMSMSGDDSSEHDGSDDSAMGHPLEFEDNGECSDSDWEDDPKSGVDAHYVDDDDDEVNMGAYDTDNLDNNGLSKTEQGGVVHLVHGWTQRGHPDEVCSALSDLE